ncbi:hypothetical protein GUJ93_ZPchr0011g27753 [Zizania palustris]|uniref:Uncharacterized protein n=1 Tax=Zizania palustris TaxID=103762 RepID=A0A8J6BLI2_ZIZPA|nr:hypothetical protein GUJ93_ZPchr0011g27753 [Zizania palustris]
MRFIQSKQEENLIQGKVGSNRNSGQGWRLGFSQGGLWITIHRHSSQASKWFYEMLDNEDGNTFIDCLIGV